MTVFIFVGFNLFCYTVGTIVGIWIGKQERITQLSQQAGRIS